ncbi:Os04g0161624 [Oryza sativa Japonica Group]|uniref:Os04g0161624 protein n=1 Tax=Oryza sativa subsp. japonica TaxID=39947 RepID=A0A0P0W712_ORYSJ|nr:Os04g0161624 [Oryza sativa Japonica Group]
MGPATATAGGSGRGGGGRRQIRGGGSVRPSCSSATDLMAVAASAPSRCDDAAGTQWARTRGGLGPVAAEGSDTDNGNDDSRGGR